MRTGAVEFALVVVRSLKMSRVRSWRSQQRKSPVSMIFVLVATWILIVLKIVVGSALGFQVRKVEVARKESDKLSATLFVPATQVGLGKSARLLKATFRLTARTPNSSNESPGARLA